MSSPAFPCLFLILLLTLRTSPAATAAADDTPTAYQILQEYGFPAGLLPEGVTGYELDKSSGKFKAYLGVTGGSTCSFKVVGYELKYESTITGVISKDKISNLKGISVKVLFLWLNIGEVTRDGDDLQLSVGIASANFGVENFEESPRCGCGFDCVNGGDGEGVKLRLKFNRFVTSLLE
ncbi:hypothetical protein RHMOL_Rhmol13G0013100 [Rhododendron molle]|uniref:Uncharacterized protein n=1 Tax=Rhododendron molle TaxID=49168 RepID=A0ACC0L1T9_RHOML|nr:hypothetical protein RHMOL_Rhmol13G0013100 [Rhododendron molle]